MPGNSEQPLPIETGSPLADHRRVVVEDQAGPLRLLAKTAATKRRKRRLESAGRLGEHFSRTIAVTSGKGGVGKTNLACNIAIQLAKSGEKTLLLDADLGLSSVDTILGFLPEKTLYDALFRAVPISEIVTLGPAGVSIITGGSGILELAHLSDRRREQFIGDLRQLEAIADWLIIDTGAGLGKTVMAFIKAANEVMVVTTPEPTAITDAYAMVKVASARNRAARLGIVVNMVSSQKEAQAVFSRISSVSRQFLSFNVHSLGFVPYDTSVSQAVRAQTPLLQAFPDSPAARAIAAVTRAVKGEAEKTSPSRGGIRGFIDRLSDLWRSQEEVGRGQRRS
jgi:flagellar biosynthesis protein FlhG